MKRRIKRPYRLSKYGQRAGGAVFPGVLFLILLLLLTTAPVISARALDPTPTVPGGIMVHVVARGDTLFNIARDYGTTVDAIATLNGISDVTQIQVGQRLLIPNADPAAPGVPTPITVAPGDSLLTLSLRYGTTNAAIAGRNGILNPQRLYIGLALILPVGSFGNNGNATGRLYTVQPDDSLYRIALRQKVTLDTLLKLNRLRSPALIVPGQKLLVPDASAPVVDLPVGFESAILSPGSPEQGRTFAVHVTTLAGSTVTGSFLDRALVFAPLDATGTAYRALIGIPALQASGLYSLQLSVVQANSSTATFTQPVWIADGGYSSESITLDPAQADLVNPAITEPERAQLLGLVTPETPTSYIGAGSLLGLPCSAPVTSQYGTRRSYNGGPFDQVHTGTDFAALPGTPITAPAGGVVVFSGTLNVRGNATVIDHGGGIYTGYWHQDQRYVKAGDTVSSGQIIGTIGATGRVTGPHLHWELFIHGVQVDPLQWARMVF